MISNKFGKEISEDIQNITKIEAIPTILNSICKITKMRFAAVARVSDAHWITCMAQDEINFGLSTGDELQLVTTICNEIRDHKNPVIIEHLNEDPEYCFNPTALQFKFQSYISYPIFRKNGDFFGTLCAIDPNPNKLKNQKTQDLFKLYSELISFHLATIEEINSLNTLLLEEQQISELRETFVAILGHDLRNPVATTRMCADLLLNLDLPALALKQAATIKSTSFRMESLINNLLDFAKTNLGQGVHLETNDDYAVLGKILDQIINETTILDPDLKVIEKINIDQNFTCDPNKIGQIFSNLLSNAVKHGAFQMPVEVTASTENDQFTLSVSNSGEKIKKENIKSLFKAYFTTNSIRNKTGLGLGLYISSEIAKAHNGKISVNSTDELTTFTFTMPLNALN